ncbi:hypothetical protein Tco_1443169, partial [Tanacetum coccineum]
MDILQNTNFFRAFTASALVPAIYIQQFWNTLTYVEKVGTYRFQLDENWFTLDANLLREALEITPIDQAYPFVSPPSGDAIMDFVNELGYSKTFLADKANLGSPTKKGRKDKPHVIPYCRFTKLIICHLGRIHNILQGSASPFHLAEEDLKLGNLKFVSKGEIDKVFGMPIPNELISNNIKNAPYYNAYLEMPAKEKSTKATPLQKASKGKVAKVRTVKSSLQLVDEPNEEPAHSEPRPEPEHQGEDEEFDMDPAIQMSLESFQVLGHAHTSATEEASTGPSTQPQDDTSTNIIRDSPSLTDAETSAGSDKTNSGGDTEILQINKELGEDVEKQVDLEEKTAELDQDQAGSDPGETHE